MKENAFLEDINTLVQMHIDGFLGGEVMPEDVLVNVVEDDEILDVLTLGMCLNYQRSAIYCGSLLLKHMKIHKQGGYLILSPL